MLLRAATDGVPWEAPPGYILQSVGGGLWLAVPGSGATTIDQVIARQESAQANVPIVINVGPGTFTFELASISQQFGPTPGGLVKSVSLWSTLALQDFPAGSWSDGRAYLDENAVFDALTECRLDPTLARQTIGTQRYFAPGGSPLVTFRLMLELTVTVPVFNATITHATLYGETAADVGV
jgi:hypothetical protein